MVRWTLLFVPGLEFFDAKLALLKVAFPILDDTAFTMEMAKFTTPFPADYRTKCFKRSEDESEGDTDPFAAEDETDGAHPESSEGGPVAGDEEEPLTARRRGCQVCIVVDFESGEIVYITRDSVETNAQRSSGKYAPKWIIAEYNRRHSGTWEEVDKEKVDPEITGVL